MCMFIRLLIPVLLLCSASLVSAQRLIIDHTCTNLEDIAPAAIDSAQARLIVHFAHKSHGRQIVYGMDALAVEHPELAVSHSIVPPPPAASGALSMYDPGRFVGEHLTTLREDLESQPEVNISMFMWCLEFIGYIDPYQGHPLTREQLRVVLDSFAVWQEDFPEVTFIYFASSAHHVTPCSSYNRWLRNKEIREECAARNGVLFDFEDLDTWYYDSTASAWVQNTIDYTPPGGEAIKLPIMYTTLYGNPDTDPSGTHANLVSQKMKAAAAWRMFAELAVGEATTPLKAPLGKPVRGAGVIGPRKAMQMPAPSADYDVIDLRGATIPQKACEAAAGKYRPAIIVPR